MKSSIGELPGAGEKVWYIIVDQGHQGPYSFIELQQKSLNASTRIWAKGWPAPLNFTVLVDAYTPVSGDEPPPLPPLPQEELDIESPEIVEDYAEVNGVAGKSKYKKIASVIVCCLLLTGGGIFFYQNKAPQLQRPESLPLPSFRLIQSAFNKTKANGPIEILGVSADFRKVWLADRTKQNCMYDLTLESNPLENLSGGRISLQAESESNNHWVLFDRWTYNSGVRLWPGHYLATLTRVGCEHKSQLLSWLKPDRNLVQTFKTSVYVGNLKDLELNLQALRNKVEKEKLKAQKALIMSWRDVEEKCRTLSAISLQIQQSFGMLLNKKLSWRNRVKNVVDRYTLRFGGFLTNFTIRNEEDFNRIARQDIPGKVLLMEKGPLINSFAKKIGLLSMNLIEWLPRKTNPKPKELLKRLTSLNNDLENVRQGLDDEAESAQKIYSAKIGPKKKKAPR